MSKFTTIPLLPATRDKLKSLGRKGETYDQILNRLMATPTPFELVEAPIEDAATTPRRGKPP
ncbi:MAG TPA: hypothetical protein VM681_02030 [Candidatus Thermoplasmatota archaeon]|nr:hypothetical protein [Candidatus Thermoplasmatota archaeon]